MNNIILISNIDKIHTTKLGMERINKNIKIETDNIIDFLKEKILNKNTIIYKKGKNWYCEIEDLIITINSFTYTIITAHRSR